MTSQCKWPIHNNLLKKKKKRKERKQREKKQKCRWDESVVFWDESVVNEIYIFDCYPRKVFRHVIF